MTNQISALLANWLKQKDDHDWVLGTIVETQGSSYRKAGAMLFINNLGQYFGLLSGGCLEADIMRQAQQVMDSGLPKVIQYDMREEDDISWKLGIGCGGMVRILLQPLNQDNQYHHLPNVLKLLTERQTLTYTINLNKPETANTILKQANQSESEPSGFLSIPLKAEPHLAVFGAGIDARPLVAMAGNLGWQITLVDHRTNNARGQYFPAATTIIRQHPDDLKDHEFLSNIDAAVVMGHNIQFDAAALSLLQKSSAGYIGMLGPKHRKQKVLNAAKLSTLSKPLSGPIGLNLGGELPESIALSILAEIHAVLEQRDARSLSGVVKAADSTPSIRHKSQVA
ncbi:xanthine dehydrogenase [Saccharobesus litoralis]|uniref:Xanthine dehydrogenase n=1 Tax=Saccharobesus litoralis TaxID=2172099 RepID=A0A2S0VLQ1_9ALTE|nr:XdhC/CoxI family protein [Saccharobesus litoralis]AWB65132.1 xanthine dehydrogenase [Saccharobesus litoralis]